MKRRIFGSLGAIALTGALALTASTATADTGISLEEDYTFTSATQMTYTLTMVDSTGTKVTQEACDQAQLAGAKSTFKQDGTTTTCALSQEADPEETATILKVSDNTFTFNSRSGTILSSLGSALDLETMKVTAHFPKGYRIESALVPDGGDTDISRDGASATWTGVTSDVNSKGSIHIPSSTRWIVLGALALVVICGVGFIIAATNRKNKKAQSQPGQFPQQGHVPTPSDQPTQGQYPQSPQQPAPGHFPEQGAQPDQSSQA